MCVWFNVDFLNIFYTYLYIFVESFENTTIKRNTVYISNKFNKIIKNVSLFFNIDTYLLAFNIVLYSNKC